MTRTRAIALVALVALGCVRDVRIGAGSDTGPTDDAEADQSDAPASDASGFVVLAEIRAEATADNASTAQQFATTLTVSVLRGGAPVSDASVTVTTPIGTVALAPSSAGTYAAMQTGYAAAYTLDVMAGTDHATAAGQGPMPHRFASPQIAESVRAGEALVVNWQPFDAPEAVIDTMQFPTTPIADTGTYTIPATAVTAPAGQMANDRVDLCRGMHATVVGASPGSDAHVIVCNHVSFVIDAT